MCFAIGIFATKWLVQFGCFWYRQDGVEGSVSYSDFHSSSPNRLVGHYPIGIMFIGSILQTSVVGG